MAQQPEEKEVESVPTAGSTPNNQYLALLARLSKPRTRTRRGSKSLLHYSSRTRNWIENASNAERMSHELHRCILNRDLVGFNTLVSQCDLTQLETSKWTPLMTCVQKRELDFTKTLLRRGASVHTRDPQKRVVLHVACVLGWVSLARLLLTHNYDETGRNRSDINVRDREDNTPLILATKSGHSELIKLVLLNRTSHGQHIDVNLRNSSGQTALHVACEKNNIQIVKHLLAHRQCEVNLVDAKGQTPLQRAVRRHRYEIVQLLLTHAANGVKSKSSARGGARGVFFSAREGINIQCSVGMTALMVAAQTRDNKMLEMLLGRECTQEEDGKNRRKRLGKWKRKSGLESENVVGEHALWLETFEKGWNVLYFLKKYKCDERIYKRVLRQLRNVIKSCLGEFDPQIPDDISKLVADMTY